MNSSLLIPLAGPLQSWSLSGPFRERVTQRIPTKSGLVGLVAACAGRPRGALNQHLERLRFHVRIDREGQRLQDFQTAQGILRANGKTDDGTALILRDYLEDAAFLACLEGDSTVLSEIHSSLLAPVFVPYLGRRSCLPSLPLWHPEALSDRLPLEAFTTFPDLIGTGGRKSLMLEADGPLTIRDQPGPNRTFLERQISMTYIELP